MENKKSHIVAGIVLISIGVAIVLNHVTGYDYYYGTIILFGIGLGMIIKSLLDEPEKRKTPVGGIILVVLGVASLIDSITHSEIIKSLIKSIAPLVLPVVLILLGVHLLMKKRA